MNDYHTTFRNPARTPIAKGAVGWVRDLGELPRAGQLGIIQQDPAGEVDLPRAPVVQLQPVRGVAILVGSREVFRAKISLITTSAPAHTWFRSMSSLGWGLR